jgi:hypothetical protein
MKEQIKLAARLYECQESAKNLFRQEYKSKVQWYIDVILNWNKQRGTDTLKTVIAICQLESVQENGFVVLMFMAAAVEIIESEKAAV